MGSTKASLLAVESSAQERSLFLSRIEPAVKQLSAVSQNQSSREQLSPWKEVHFKPQPEKTTVRSARSEGISTTVPSRLRCATTGEAAAAEAVVTVLESQIPLLSAGRFDANRRLLSVRLLLLWGVLRGTLPLAYPRISLALKGTLTSKTGSPISTVPLRIRRR